MNSTELLLTLLQHAENNEVSGEEISRHFGVTRAAVCNWIKELRAQGHIIEARPRRGYRLVCENDLPSPERIAKLSGLDKKLFLHKPATGSTNRDAMDLASKGATDGTCVVADRQDAGKGRQLRVWFSPAGKNLYFSIVIRPKVELARATSLPLLAGLCVAKALENLVPEIKPQIKWPNDILCDGKKLCGILCEMQTEEAEVSAIIVGIGINVNVPAEDFPEELRDTATSILAQTGRKLERDRLLAEWLKIFGEFRRRWEKEGLSPFIPELAKRDFLFGKSITLDRLGEKTEGTAEGINPDGSLRLKTKGNVLPVYSGEAHIGLIRSSRNAAR